MSTSILSTALIPLVENYAKKNHNRFPIGVLLNTPALQSLNNCKFVFLGLPTDTLGVLGRVIHRWKGLGNTFPTVSHTPMDI